MKIRILLADDHMIVRQGLKLVLDTDSEMEVVGQAENGREAVQMVRQLRPDVILLDIMMPEINGMEATCQIRKAFAQCRIIILSSYSDEDRAGELMQEGAVGYVLKQTAGAELLEAIREVRKGNLYFSPGISRSFRERTRQMRPGERAVSRDGRLTARERQVLVLIAQGAPNKAIGADLGISVKTVEKHRQNVMNKLEIHDTAGLTRYAVSSHAIDPKAPAEPALGSRQPL